MEDLANDGDQLQHANRRTRGTHPPRDKVLPAEEGMGAGHEKQGRALAGRTGERKQRLPFHNRNRRPIETNKKQHPPPAQSLLGSHPVSLPQEIAGEMCR